MYVVTVLFTAKAAAVDTFREALIANARASRQREPGCRQFDVAVDPAQPARFYLNELYDDRAAFDAHLASEHFKAFDAQARDWVAEKVVQVFERIDP